MAFNLYNAQIVFFPLDEEFNDSLEEKFLDGSFYITHNVTHKFVKK